MRIKSTIKYNLDGMKLGLGIFYCIIAVLITLALVNGLDRRSKVNFIGGMEAVTLIFLFVSGLNSFKSNFKFLSANGVSRKTQFKAFLISAFVISVFMAVIDTIWSNILPEFIAYRSMFAQAYSGWFPETTKVVLYGANFTWLIAYYCFTFVLGYLITALYYRMPKLLKIVVSVGVPGLLFVALPIIDTAYSNGRISQFVSDFFEVTGGLRNGINPFIGVISLLSGTAIVAILSFLLVRKAAVRE